MANKQIEEFPLVTSVEVGDILHLSRGGADRSIGADVLVPTVGSSGTVVVDTFTDGVEYTAGSSNTISISQTLASKRNAWVFFKGIYQEKATYTLSGTLITFDEVIPVGVSTIEVVMPLVLEVGQTSAENIIFSTNGNVEELLGKTLVFSSVAAMDTADWLQVGMFCTTLGYSSAGAGGDNTYQIVPENTGTPDNGEFINLSGSGLQAFGLFTKGFRTPKQYGASSDVAALPDTDATPSVKRGDYYLTTGTTTITDFIEGRVGQTIHIQATDSITIQDNANIVLGDGNDYAMVIGDVLVLTQYQSGVWTEEARGSVGGGGGGTYLSLTDTDNSYTGLAQFVPVVNGAEDALAFGPAILNGLSTPVTLATGVSAAISAFNGGSGDITMGASRDGTHGIFNGGIGNTTISANRTGIVSLGGNTTGDVELGLGATGTVRLGDNISSNGTTVAIPDDIPLTFGATSQGLISYSSIQDNFSIGATGGLVLLGTTNISIVSSDETDNQHEIVTSQGSVLSWSSDGIDTSVSLDYNGNPLLTVDENGVTIPDDVTLTFGTTNPIPIISAFDGLFAHNLLIGALDTSPANSFIEFLDAGSLLLNSGGTNIASLRANDEACVAWTSDGVDTSVSLQHNGTTNLTVDVSGITTENVNHGFFGAVPVAQPIVTGDKTADLQAVVTSLLSALDSLGLIDDQTT